MIHPKLKWSLTCLLICVLSQQAEASDQIKVDAEKNANKQPFIHDRCGPGPRLDTNNITHFSEPCTYRLFSREKREIFQSPEPLLVAEFQVFDERGKATLRLANGEKLTALTTAEIAKKWGNTTRNIFDYASPDSKQFLFNAYRNKEAKYSPFLIELLFKNDRLTSYRVTNACYVDAKANTCGLQRTTFIDVETEDPRN